MPAEQLTVSFASEERMPGLFADIRLRVSPDAVDLARVNSPSGMSLLADHDASRPIARVREARIDGGVGYARIETPETDPPRAAPYMQEIRAGLRTGISPGFLIHEAELVEDSDGEPVMEITRWEPYEISSTPVPRMRSIGLLSRDRLKASAASTTTTTTAPRAALPGRVSSVPGQVRAAPLPATKQAAALRERETDIAKREATVNRQTAVLDSKLSQAAQARTNGKTPGAPGPAQTATLADAVSALGRMAVNPNERPHLPDGVEVGTRQERAVEAVIPAAMFHAAIDTSTAYGTSTEGVGPAYLPAAPDWILALPTPLGVEVGTLSFPVITANVAAAMVAEGGALPTPADPTGSGQDAALRKAAAVTDISLEAAIQGGPALDSLLTDTLSVSLRALQAAQMLAGDGTAPNLQGLEGLTGIGSATYTATDKGSASSFLAAEKALENIDGLPDVRRAWAVSSDLYDVARTTPIDPGDSQFVIRDRRVLGDLPALKASDLPAGTALLVEWSAIVLVQWAGVRLYINGVSTPGTLRLSAIQLFNVVTRRPDAIVKLAQV